MFVLNVMRKDTSSHAPTFRNWWAGIWLFKPIHSANIQKIRSELFLQRLFCRYIHFRLSFRNKAAQKSMHCTICRPMHISVECNGCLSVLRCYFCASGATFMDSSKNVDVGKITSAH